VEDLRLKTSWRVSLKRRLLQRKLGAEGVLALVDLWTWCAIERPSGDLAGIGDDEIEIACDWTGAPGALVAALVELRLLDGAEGARSVHDWAEHNGYCATAADRSASAKVAAAIRWHNQGRHAAPWPGCPLCEGNAVAMRSQCGRNARAMRIDAKGNAPSPDPSPDPDPSLPRDLDPSHVRGQPDVPADAGPSRAQQPLTLIGAPERVDRDAELVHAAFAQWRAKHPGRPQQLGSADKRYKQILARVREGYTRDDLLEAVEGAHLDAWVKEHKAWTIQHIFRSGDMVEKYAQAYRERVNACR
jgi:hypothetical protein